MPDKGIFQWGRERIGLEGKDRSGENNRPIPLIDLIDFVTEIILFVAGVLKFHKFIKPSILPKILKKQNIILKEKGKRDIFL